MNILKKKPSNFLEYGHECYCEDGADAQNWIIEYDVFFCNVKKEWNVLSHWC